MVDITTYFLRFLGQCDRFVRHGYYNARLKKEELRVLIVNRILALENH